ncbi:MAG TPA: NAD-dependent epimerase/dehydratase family protein [Opitutaceae bacterium]|nr:NAD-dependent epimerase/dehydratase family protein [Opitutaceae bacterium]HND60264.1 NAD-dependent epimerase/dehydratase family protein [Opitutaceae bacterium]
MATILVTGAAGFIGSHTTDLLLAEGHRVVGVDNFRTGRRENLTGASRQSGFEFHELDVAVPGALAGLVARSRPEAIIHLAALVSVQESIANPELNFVLNVQATQLVAEAARLHQVRRIVFASSAALYGDTADLPVREGAVKRPVSPYGAAKLASEDLLLGHAATYGLTVRCQRYFNVFGPRQDPSSPYSGVISIFARRYAEGKPVMIFGDGQQTRDFIAVRDVARANLLAATRPGLASGAANICTGRSTSLLDLAAVFGRHHPGVPGPLHAPARAGDIVHSLGAPDVAAAELGFNARTTVADGLAELAGTPAHALSS